MYLLLLALLASATTMVSAVSPTCFSGNQLCYQAAPTTGSTTTADILISTTLKQGWVAVGFGRKMDSTDMIMLWRNSTGAWVASRRFSTQQSLPPAAPNQNVQIINSTTTANAQGFYQVHLRRPIASSSTNSADKTLTNSAMTMAYALSSASGVSASNLPQHDTYGTFTYNPLDPTSAAIAISTGASTDGLPTGGTSSGSSSFRPTAILLHGLFMAISWSFLSLTSSFVARYLKQRLGAKWFPIHRVAAMAIFALTIAGFLLIYLTTDGDHFDSLHAIIGLLVFIGMFVQIALGVYIHKSFDPARKEVPVHDKAHWVFGYVLVAAAAVNVVLGHLKNNSATVWLAINLVVLVGGVVAFGYGETRLGQSHDHAVPHEDDGTAGGYEMRA
ncbi:hypothetical protein BC828DRAFT_379482 [Blastocladiella britannica]|nr:hypothetical protein BC828DRAFT_379482 [Blastocladiella britannica]